MFSLNDFLESMVNEKYEVREKALTKAVIKQIKRKLSMPRQIHPAKFMMCQFFRAVGEWKWKIKTVCPRKFYCADFSCRFLRAEQFYKIHYRAWLAAPFPQCGVLRIPGSICFKLELRRQLKNVGVIHIKTALRIRRNAEKRIFRWRSRNFYCACKWECKFVSLIPFEKAQTALASEKIERRIQDSCF